MLNPTLISLYMRGIIIRWCNEYRQKAKSSLDTILSGSQSMKKIIL